MNKVRKARFEINRCFYANVSLFPVIAIIRMVKNLLSPSSGKISSEYGHVPAMLNSLLAWLYRLDVKCAVSFNAPFGLSLVVVAQRTEEENPS